MEARIKIMNARPGKVQSGTLYARDVDGNVYKFNGYVASDDMGDALITLGARPYIRWDRWTLVKAANRVVH